MRRSLRWSLLALVCFAQAAWAATPEERGWELARMADKAAKGYVGEEADVELEIISAHGDTVTRKMRFKALEVPNDGNRVLLVVHSPADVKGTKMLTWTHKKGDDDQWIYLPAMKRTTRIAARAKTGSFMGSEFSYEDLAISEIEKFTYKYIEDTQHDGRPVWKIERYPVDKASGYTKHVFWLDKEYLLPLRIDYYDRKNELLKTSLGLGFHKVGKYWRPTTITMDNVQTKKKSRFKWQGQKIGVQHEPNLFERNGLED